MKGPAVLLERHFSITVLYCGPRQEKAESRRVGNPESHLHPPPEALVDLRGQVEPAAFERPAIVHGVSGASAIVEDA